MKIFRIYGDDYMLSATTSEAPDAYAYRGAVFETEPPGKFVGYVTLPDNSVLACYYKKRLSVVIIPIAIVLFVALAVIAYFVFLQPKDVKGFGDFMIKQGTDKDVVTYNGFMAISDGEISVNFQNGSEPATISVVGDGISTEQVQVEPEQFVASIPATFTTELGLVQAKLVISTETSTVENNVAVEIPDNNTDNSPEEGLEGYWKGEYIYGTDTEGTE